MRNKSIQSIREVFDKLNFYDACPDCRGRCCYMPWMPDEECNLVQLFADNVEKLGKTHFFLDREHCKFLDSEGNCTIYKQRPLDCRLYPLDIIEENNNYYWCLFTDCPGWEKMQAILRPHIPRIESHLTPSLWRQFKQQIAITKATYEPYKNGRYVIVSPFSREDLLRKG